MWRRSLRRLDADRPLTSRAGERERQARAGARGRQEPRDRHARRRSDFATNHLIAAGLRFGRSALHGHQRRRRGGRRGRRAGGAAAAKALEIKVGPGLEPTARWARWSPRPRATGSSATSADRRRHRGRRPRAGHRRRRLLGRPDAAGQRAPPTCRPTRDEIFGPVLAVVRVDTLDEAIELINRNAYANGTAIFTGSGHAARTFQRGIQVRDDRRQRADPGAAWPSTASAAGRTACSATSTSTAPRASASTRGPRSSRPAGRRTPDWAAHSHMHLHRGRLGEP